MAGVIGRFGHRFIGLMCGTTLAYGLAVALGLVMRSWPINEFFLTVAGICLLLQTPYWLRLYRQPEPLLRQGLVAGLLLMGALWLAYFL